MFVLIYHIFKNKHSNIRAIGTILSLKIASRANKSENRRNLGIRFKGSIKKGRNFSNLRYNNQMGYIPINPSILENLIYKLPQIVENDR